MVSRCEKERSRGAVYVEFLIVVFPMLILMFGLTHIGLSYAVHLMVGHAAARAARAAIVILPDETGDYAGVEPLRIGTGEGEGLDAYRDAPEDGRYDQIRKAARLTLSPVSPSIDGILGDSLAEGIGDHPGTSTVVGLLPGGWADKGVALTFPDGEGYLSQFSERQDILVRITYLYKCQVPIIRGLVCDTFDGLRDRSRKELEIAGADGLLQKAGSIAGWRFLAITQERALPNQGKPR